MAVNEAKKNQIMENTVKHIKDKMPDEIFDKYSRIGEGIDVDTIPTGSLAVDEAIGGGFAKNRVIDIVGHTSSGKTTLALTSAATMQKEYPDANILYCDAEQTLDPHYAEALGVNVNDMYIMQPSSGEAGFEAVEMFIASGVADLVVIDSIAAMLPKAMIERDYDEDAQPGQFAKLISTAIGRINKMLKKNQCTVILINQWKPVVKIDRYSAVPGAMGNWYQPGGAQMPFFCSQIIEVKKSGEIKSGKKVESSVTTMTCKKNKIAPPYRSADFVITYGEGLDRVQELISLGHNLGFIKLAGSFYKIPELFEGALQGRTKLGNYLKNNPEQAQQLEDMIKKEIKGERDIVYGDGEENDKGSEESEIPDESEEAEAEAK